MKNIKQLFIISVAVLIGTSTTYALPAQNVSIPDDPSIAPQLNFSGVGLVTLGYDKSAETPGGKSTITFSDSALQVGAAEKLFEDGAVGSFIFGWLTSDESHKGTGNPYFLYRALVDFQNETSEIIFGRSDRQISRLVDFPTLRGDDLITLTSPLNPLSNGKTLEEHRYANVASFTINQMLTYFENIHVERLIASADPNADNGINSFGASFQYLGPPGLESFELFPSWGLRFERISIDPKSADAVNQTSVGGVINLNQSVVNRFELGLQDIYSWGSDLTALSSATDSFTANANAAAASLRFLRRPFGRPSWQLALTAGYKNYLKISDATSTGMALTGIKRLGHGFDLVAQYVGQWRSSNLAAAQSQNISYEQRAEIGLSFNFDATLNEHLALRRSLLNQQHHFLSE